VSEYKGPTKLYLEARPKYNQNDYTTSMNILKEHVIGFRIQVSLVVNGQNGFPSKKNIDSRPRDIFYL